MQVKLFRVFTNPHGQYGDQASVVVDQGRKIPDGKRQEIALNLKTGETIFINNIENAEINVMHPQGEISFAGVGVLATAWCLSKLQSKRVEKLSGRYSEITNWQDGQLSWIRTDIKTLPHWHIQQTDTVSEIEQMNVEETSTLEHAMRGLG